MNNNTWGTWAWIAVMLVLIIILRTADGGMDGVITQLEGLLLAVTETATGTVGGVSAPAVPALPVWAMLGITALLIAGGVMVRKSGGDARSGVRKYLAVECQLWAKDLDA
ncbi:MAG: hypothetical protein K0U66_06340 [Gammaproteobacteria bacterium]|nr:hypothetical protein [Gammaproteobacteria bacterium]